MKGKILDYMINTSSGVISGDDGNRYRFNASEWMQNDSFPQQGASVDFVVDGEKDICNCPSIFAKKNLDSSHYKLIFWGFELDIWLVGFDDSIVCRSCGRAYRKV